MDFEQSISQLTPEQERIVASIQPARSLLIKGGAGTGKSLVLIERLRRFIQQKELPLSPEQIPQQAVVLVTFTRALVKYNRFISDLKEMRIAPEIINTVDSLFLNKLQRICPDSKYDFELLDRWITPENTPPFFTPEELASEIENFLFAEGITEKEYLERFCADSRLR